ncbi:transport and Golgi organization protein 1 homolog isoform X2 [Danio aesculapii]|uniref:transport and Golgi organization protein 1 homolog isoform X2 n=1 Tax=Danio aesculapii TaxID=1142201 RepID=UPI0024C06394|nr:transport and Golgi organization protein 1 homolog isoform X2 [Danio aesculapii]
MAAPNNPRFYSLFTLLLCSCFGGSCADRRFSELKRCADEECSMLLGRGKAAKDFMGPDCRFLSFKKGETIYVYYKLSGQRSDVWAGSVGNHFGYFPKDYLNINHIYTEKELEVPTEETDFVCFETGLDKFESYDIDVLLGSKLFMENENSTEESKEAYQNEVVSQLPSETEEITEDSVEHLDSESESLLQSESVDSESRLPLQSESIDSESVLILEPESVDSESRLPLESESVNSEPESTHESESVSSETELIHESESVDSELATHHESVSVDSKPATTPESESVDSESQSTDLESTTQSTESKSTLQSNDSKSTSQATDSESTSQATDSESTSQATDSESTSQSTDSESISQSNHSKSTSRSSDSESTTRSSDSESTLQSNNSESTLRSSDSESTLQSSDSESTLQSSDSESTTQSTDLESTLPFESESVDSESTLLLESESVESETLISKSTENDSNSFQPKTVVSSESTLEPKHGVTDETDTLITQDDVETQPSDFDALNIDDVKLLHIQHDSDFESELETQTAGLDVDSEEPTNRKDLPLQTSEKTLEDENRWTSALNEKSESEETESSHEHTKESLLVHDVKAQRDLEEEETIDNVKFSLSSQSTKSASDESEGVPSEPAPETESIALDISEITENTNENADDFIQKDSMNTNENAHKNIADDAQDVVINRREKPTESEDEDETENVSESPESAPLLYKTDEQIEKVKNELDALLKNTLESEEDSPGDEEDETEELLEDENALLSSNDPHLADKNLEDDEQPDDDDDDDDDGLVESQQSENTTQADETETEEVGLPPEEPEYSDSVLRLTILRDHLKDEDTERMQKYFGLKNMFRIEAMFSDLDLEMKSAREMKTDTEEIEQTLDQITEASENSILDATEDILNERDRKALEDGLQKEPEMYDIEAAMLDAFQEIVFALRQKYSTASDSVPLVEEEQSAYETDEKSEPEELKNLDITTEMTEPAETPEMHKEQNDSESILSPEFNMNPDLSHNKDVDLEEDGGHFNRNKDAQIAFEDAEEIQKGPHAILEKPVDIGFHFEMDQSSGSMESPSVSDFHDAETGSDSSSPSTSDELQGLLVLLKENLGVYGEVLITALPEEWRPGPNFHGVPWEPVVVTVAIGALTILMFFWRTVLSIKGRSYQLTEKQLRDKIQQLLNEKSDAANKITELNDMIKEREQHLQNSEKSLSSSQHEIKGLKNHQQKMQSQWEQMSGSISQLNQTIVDTQEENANLNEKIAKMHQRIEKYQKTLKSYDDERAKVHVLMDEAKLREDALKAQVLSFEKENGALKEQKKSLLGDAKDWQEKHKKLSEEIRVYHKSQKELEDSLVHKENEIDVLSSCIAELNRLGGCDSAELQKEDARMSNGDDSEKKMDTMRLRIKQMMDVSRIKATLSVVEDERNRYMENLLTEQKSRQELEEQYQKVMHDQMNLNNEKTHLENQMKNLQQRLEITTELYQQKENALQQKLTQEELERREKETKLSEVDSKALRSEEEVRALKQKIKDIEEEMQQNERSLKSEVAVQEKKAHENWLKARASERTLVEERRESATLRQKLVEYRDKISDMEQSLFKLNSGPPDRHMPQRRGDSYGPSPVSGGAPSPPLMIEGPGRPPSAPVGRRGEPFGPRPPSDPHGRFSELGHPLPSRPEMFQPMTSSPCAHDGPMTAPVVEPAEASDQASCEPVETLSKSQSQGSFLPSPIRDSPVPPPNVPLKPYGPPGMPPNGPPMMIRPPNGHPPMMHLDPRFRPPHMDSFGPPPPIRPFGPVPPPFARGPPLGQRDVPPDYFAPRGLPPRPFPSGPLPPPGAMIPPPYSGLRFPAAPAVLSQSSRDGDEEPPQTHAEP